ncbi:MAG: ABC transporter permease [Acidobacteria bacterium]|nr:ABC transporter permease [Acidobacteriota bacterium]
MKRRDRDADLERELAFHLDQQAARLAASGLDEAGARRQARLELGPLESIKEECRAARPFHGLERLWADLLFSLRSLRHHPASTVSIIATVAVCVALNTGVYTVVESLLLRPLPFDDSARIVLMANQYPKAGFSDSDNSAAGDYTDRRGRIPAFSDIALVRSASHPLESGGALQQLKGLAVTPGFFPLLRVQPAEGRLLTESDAREGSERVILLTHEFRRSLFGDTPAIGRKVRLGGLTTTIVGVLPPGFRYLSGSNRYFLPLRLDPASWRRRHSNDFQLIARLRDGATLQQAQSQVDALNVRMLDEEGQLKPLIIQTGYHSTVLPLHQRLVRGIRPTLQLLWIAALLVLTVGAVNLAGLAVARGGARVREMATRLALGATRADLARLCLLENLIPALAGAALGLTAALALLPALDLPVFEGIAAVTPSPTVFLYAFAAALAAGAFAGIGAVLPFTRLAVAHEMKEGGRGATFRGSGLRRWLVAAQLALSFVLLHGAGVVTASLHQLTAQDPGFHVDGVSTISTALPGSLYPSDSAVSSAIQRAVLQLRQVSGVQLASAASDVPFAPRYSDSVVMPDGRKSPLDDSAISPVRLKVLPGYFEALGVSPLRGRLFDARDGEPSRRAVIIDQTLARRFWPGLDPVGRKLGYALDPPEKLMTVLAVVPSVRLQDLSGAGTPHGVYYVPFQQEPESTVTFLWRGSSASADSVRSALASALPGAALFDASSLPSRLNLTLQPQRDAQSLVAIFAGVALFLAALGIYGLLAFWLAQRRREIAIRLALGCRPSGVVTLLLRHSLSLLALGLVAGLAITVPLQPWIASRLFGVSRFEPLVTLSVAGVLLLAAALAMAAPVWRGTRLEAGRVLAAD